MSIWKPDVWLMQRLCKPIGFKNPWGDVNNQVKDVKIAEVINPDYMGAAEYEWGVYNKCIETMQKHGTNRRWIYIYPEHKNVPVNIISANGCEESEVNEQVRYLYLEVSRKLHETGDRPEISKSDYGSFYRACNDDRANLAIDKAGHKYIGWLNVKKYYAIFLNGDDASNFNKYFNQIEEVVA